MLEDVNGKLCIKSRVGLLGPNGAGKTTLLRQLVGDLLVDQGTGKHKGEITKHQNLRIAYISQSSMHHLEDFMTRKPWEYIQVLNQLMRLRMLTDVCWRRLTFADWALRYSQERFKTGLDKELAKRETMKLVRTLLALLVHKYKY